MQGPEVSSVVRHDHPTAVGSQRQLCGVVRLRHMLIPGRKDGKAPLAQGFGQVVIDAFVQIDGCR